MCDVVTGFQGLAQAGGEDANWEYGAFATNTPTGQVQWLDARHRTQAHVEDRIKQLKACGARNLPSIDYDRNTAWLQLAALATSLTAWLRHLALDGDLAKAGSSRDTCRSGKQWIMDAVALPVPGCYDFRDRRHLGTALPGATSEITRVRAPQDA